MTLRERILMDASVSALVDKSNEKITRNKVNEVGV